jgi:hypothetical protein
MSVTKMTNPPSLTAYPSVCVIICTPYDRVLEQNVRFLRKCTGGIHLSSSLFRLILSYSMLNPYLLSRYIATEQNLHIRCFVHTDLLLECKQNDWEVPSCESSKPVHLICNVPGLGQDKIKQIRQTLQRENHPACIVPEDNYWLIYEALQLLPLEELAHGFAVYRLDVLHIF